MRIGPDVVYCPHGRGMFNQIENVLKSVKLAFAVQLLQKNINQKISEMLG